MKTNPEKIPKKRGRKPSPKTGADRKVAQSMKQAEAFWNVPVKLQMAAKAAGCLAFVEHRVHRDELLEWIAANPDVGKNADKGETLEELKRQELIEKITLLKLKNAKEERTTIDKEEVRQHWAKGMAIIQEEAKNMINDDDRYRIFCERIKARLNDEL